MIYLDQKTPHKDESGFLLVRKFFKRTTRGYIQVIDLAGISIKYRYLTLPIARPYCNQSAHLPACMSFWADRIMYNVPWQKGRVFQTPVGVLTASFVLRPNTMFHPEGEWAVRLVLPHLYAYRLRQLIAPAYDDIVARAKEMYLQLPLEQQARRPFKENPFWQAAATEGGQETENISFAFRLPTIDRTTTVTAPTIVDPGAAAAIAAEKPKRKRKAAVSSESPAIEAVAAKTIAATSRRGKAGSKTETPTIDPADANSSGADSEKMSNQGSAAAAPFEVATRVPLLDRHGREMSNLSLEPDGWNAVVHFSIQQYWLRTFGAGVTLRLNAVQLFNPQQRPGEIVDDGDLRLSIAL